MTLPTADRLRALLSYDKETGTCLWRARPVRAEYSRTDRAWNSRFAGNAAGSSRNDGYYVIGIDGRVYLAHRLIWVIVTGAWPTSGVDHRDVNGLNNSWANLRESTQSQNCANTHRRLANKSGLKGVHKSTGREKYIAQICRQGAKIYLGSFGTPEEAHAAYCVGAELYFGEFRRVA
jgi:hypothetical protein